MAFIPSFSRVRGGGRPHRAGSRADRGVNACQARCAGKTGDSRKGCNTREGSHAGQGLECAENAVG